MKYTFTTLLLLFFANLHAQETIRGRVFDYNTNEAIIGANIINASSKEGTTTDPKGFFAMPFTGKIQVSAIGYKTQTISIAPDDQFLNIGLAIAYVNLGEVTIAANPTKEKLLATSGAIGFINKRDIQRDNQVNIAPALNRIPGVYMHSGALNTNRITIRGIGARTLFSTNKVRAYLNDIPLTTGAGETTIEDIDLSLIDRIEVIKGPSSSLYGAGLGGTIHLRTEKAKYRKSQLIQENSFGSYGLFRNTTGIRTSGDKANINLIYNKTESDGYRDNNEVDRTNLLALGEFYVDEKQSLTFLGNYIQLKAFIPSGINRDDYLNNPTAAAFTWGNLRGFEDYDKLLLGISHQLNFEENWELKTALFSGFRTSYELRPFNILKEESQNVGVRSYVSYSPTIGARNATFILGGEYFTDWYQWRTYVNNDRNLGNILSDNEEIRSYFNLFLQSKIELTELLTVHAGMNINETTYDYQDFFVSNGDQSGEYSFQLTASPRVALNYQWQAQNFAYVSASHGFSPPSVEETLTPDGRINPDIQPETGWNYELGFKGYLVNNQLFYDVSAYTMHIRNLLVARRVGDDQFVGINAGETTHNGIELNLNYHFFPHADNIELQAFINATLTYYEFKEFIDGENDFSGNRLTGTPQNTWNAGLDFDTKLGFYGNLNYQFVDEMPLRDDNSVFSESYSLFNVKVGYQKLLFEHLQLDVSAGINNLLDEKYASMLLINAGSFGGNAPRYYYPGLPRNYFGGIALGYVF